MIFTAPKILAAAGAISSLLVVAARRETETPPASPPPIANVFPIVNIGEKADRAPLPLLFDDRIPLLPQPRAAAQDKPAPPPVAADKPERAARHHHHRDICRGNGRRWYAHHRFWHCNR
jgi:hypothetical protein